MVSNAFRLGSVLTPGKTTLGSSSLPTNIANAGFSIVQSTSDLPSSVSTGAQSFVRDTKMLYIYNGSNWYKIAAVNQSPSSITGVNASYTLATDGTATTITAVATDPEGFPLTWSSTVSSGSLNGTTVSQVDNVFTITPHASNATSFSITFNVTDGANSTVSVVSQFSLSFYTQGSALFGRWDIGNSTSYSGTGTTWNDLSGNGRNLTIQNGAYNSSGINGSTAVWDWTTQNSARIDFPTDISSVKTFIVIWGFTSTTPNTRLMILNGNSTGNYAGFTDANDTGNNVPGGDGSYAGITAHTGETIVTTMNGNSVTGPAVLYNGMQQGYLNLFALRGAKFTDSTAKYANYFGYNHPHQLRAILMWDVMLTDSEIKDVYDTFPSSAMATWDG